MLPHIGRGRGWNGLLLPAPEFLKVTFSKNEALDLARAIGVPVPRTEVPATEAAVARIGADLGFPLLVKGEKGSAARHLHIVERQEDLLPRYRDIVALETGCHGRPASQEWVPGRGYSIGGLFDEGRPVRVLAQRSSSRFRRGPAAP
jgi:biotin carboxylase